MPDFAKKIALTARSTSQTSAAASPSIEKSQIPVDSNIPNFHSNPHNRVMRELDADNVLDYLKATGHLTNANDATAELLTGGVSNVVVRISRPDGDDFVIKQSRTKLRTAVDWQSRLERIWREADVMRTLSPLLPPGTIPAVLFEDRDNYLFAMEAIEPDHVVWKTALLAVGSPQASRGEETNEEVAELAASALARIHSATAGVAEYRDRWSDITDFDELRLDPYYRFIARRHPAIQPAVDALIEQTITNAVCVVSADFSPKNILLTQSGIALVDFETAHYGDPAFDLGFFLTHLLLKSVHFADRGEAVLELARAFWRKYLSDLRPVNPSPLFEEPELSRRTAQNLTACLLARIDGKSPVEYLSETERDFVRSFTLRLFESMPTSVEQIIAQLREYP